MHVVVVGCGRVGSELAVALEEVGHTVAVDRQEPQRVPPAPRAASPARPCVGFGFDRDHLSRPASSEAGRWPRSPTATTPTSSSPGSPGRPSGSSRWWPASTTPGGPLIYQRLGIPTVATVSWTTDQVLRRLLPDAARTEWTDATGEVRLVERPLPRVGRPQADRARRGRPLRLVGADPARRGPARRRRRSSPRRATSPLAVGADAPRRARRPARPARDEGRHAMRVVIAGGGNVGTFIAADLAEAGHEVLLIEQDRRPGRPGSRSRRSSVEWVVADACEVSVAARGRPRRRRRRRRGHRRRRGQPRHLAARQAGVRRAPRRGPGQPPEERVAVQRDVGRRRRRCRRRTCSPRWSRRPCRSGRSCACCSFEGGQARLVEVTLADDVAGRRQGRSRSSACPATPRSWPSSASDHVIVPRGDTVLAGRRRGARARHPGVGGRRPRPPRAGPRGDGSEQLVARVQQPQPTLLAVGRPSARHDQPLPGRHAGDAAPAGPHDDERSRAVADRRLQPR